MNSQGLIDYRNIDLWNRLNNIQEIEIQFENRKDYLVSSKNKNSIIYIPSENIDSASFTHELLHIDLWAKQIFIGAGLKGSIRENRLLSRIISFACIDHISNCLQHMKMLPEFIQMGYSVEDFLLDYKENKLTDEEVLKIQTHFVVVNEDIKKYKASIIDLYIGKYFAAISCPNISIDYSNQLNSFRNLDPELFQILEKFVSAWNDFDHNYEDPVFGRNYNDFLNDFILDMGNWVKGKTII